MASSSPGAHVLPHAARTHLQSIIRHVRALHPEVDAAWDDDIVHALEAMLRDVGMWSKSLARASRLRLLDDDNEGDVIGVMGDSGGDSKKELLPGRKGKEKGKGKENDDDSSRSRRSSPARPSVSSAVPAESLVLDWLHSRLANSLKNASPSPDSSVPATLVLTFAPSVPSDSQSDRSCVWAPREFCLPLPDHLCGNDGVEPSVSEHLAGELVLAISKPASSVCEDVHLVGGALHLRGVKSREEERALRNVVRVAAYTSLSLLLESHALSDFLVPFPPSPKPSRPASPALPPIPSSEPSPTSGEDVDAPHHKHKHSGFWNFLTRRRDPLRFLPAPQHSPTIPSAVPPIPPPKDAPVLKAVLPTPPVDTVLTPSLPRFERALSDLSALSLSTSPSVRFPPPAVLLKLRAREAHFLSSGKANDLGALSVSSRNGHDSRSSSRDSSRVRAATKEKQMRLTGEEKAALRTLRGGDETLDGWVAHQRITLLVSRWVPAEASSKSLAPSSSSISAEVGNQNLTSPERSEERKDVDMLPNSVTLLSTSCVPPRWRTFSYFSDSSDRRLGHVIQHFCSLAEEDGQTKCDRQCCGRRWTEHRWGWACAGVRVEASLTVDPREGNAIDGISVQPEDVVEMWTQCSVCGVESDKRLMQDCTYLYSFAKYLELLLFSRTMTFPSICEHTRPPNLPSAPDIPTTVPSSSSAPLSPLLHHFSNNGNTVTFSLFPLNMYELCVPRLQIGDPSPSISSSAPVKSNAVPVRERRSAEAKDRERRETLRLEVTTWFGHAKRWTKALEAHLRQLKALPRKPARQGSTSASRSLVRSEPAADDTDDVTQADVQMPLGRLLADDLSATSILRASLRADQISIYNDLKPWATVPLNDVRRHFMKLARQSRQLMSDLERGYSDVVGTCSWEEPEWWKDDIFVLPGSWVLIKADEPGSIISYMLSCTDYQKALVDAGTSELEGGSKSHDVQPSSTPAVPSTSPETWSAVITRRESPRDVAALLTMQVLGSRTTFAKGSPSGKSASNSPSSKLLSNGTPKKAWAAPDVAVSYQSARGDLHAADDVLVERLLQDMDSDTSLRHKSSSALSVDEPSSSSAIAIGDAAAVGAVEATKVPLSRPSQLSSSPSAFRATLAASVRSSRSSAGSEATVVPNDLGTGGNNAQSGSTSTSTTTSSLNMFGDAVRYLTSTTRALLSLSTSDEAPLTTSHLPLLAVDRARSSFPAIDDRPHIRYDWTVGKRLKFSCTAYYAQQFEALRRLCGVDTDMVESLAKSLQWQAEGGKSRSQFFKSEDDKFIIKTLVNAWHVSDLHVLLDVAPIFFQYIDSIGDKPSAIAKLLGFYSIEVKNSETSSQSKVDVLVMENLFHNQRVDRVFDLKGIAGRKVKVPGRHTLFDAEWIESQQRQPMYITPHSRLIVRDAVREDASFLTSSNIMDYSMLLGIDDDSRQIACGLVDTIGSYNVAKTLEYTAKQSLKSGNQVTVIPPAEYEARFVGAMESYFVACPDKWTRTSSRNQGPSSVLQLPAVL